jgi:anti-sigma28 factor (negative regulator of flagellin synthesis)
MPEVNGTVEEPYDRILREKGKQNASTQEKIDTLNEAIRDGSYSFEELEKIQNHIAYLNNLAATTPF